MLTNVKLSKERAKLLFDYTDVELDACIDNSRVGVYDNVGFNFHFLLDNDTIIDEYPDYWPPAQEPEDSTERLRFFRDQILSGGYFGAYGVADNIEQILDKYAPYVNDPDNYYCISTQELLKSQQPKEGGWRWHKWGQYIGTQEPQCEYLADEPVIESIYVYHVYQVKPPA